MPHAHSPSIYIFSQSTLSSLFSLSPTVSLVLFLISRANMCRGVSEFNSNRPFNPPFCPRGLERSRIQVQRLTRWSCRRSLMETEMEIKNLKLYLENQSIIEENAKLKKKALSLLQENQVLVLELEKKNKTFSNLQL